MDKTVLYTYGDKKVVFDTQWLTERVREDFRVGLGSFKVLYTYDDVEHYRGLYEEELGLGETFQ